MMPQFCIDCDWHKESYFFGPIHRCYNPALAEVDPVTGAVTVKHCSEIRTEKQCTFYKEKE